MKLSNSRVMLMVLVCSLLAAMQVRAQSELQGMASVSGTVTSSSPFQAAKVYFRNSERRMQYMVYTAGGKYHVDDPVAASYLVPPSRLLAPALSRASRLDQPMAEIMRVALRISSVAAFVYVWPALSV